MSPSEEYRARLSSWNSRLSRAQRQYSQFGNARLATGIAAVAVGGFSIGVSMISPWWLLVPLVIFIALAIALERLDSERESAARGVAYYERGMGRIEDRWIGKGSQGERFRDSKHVYAVRLGFVRTRIVVRTSIDGKDGRGRADIGGVAA